MNVALLAKFSNNPPMEMTMSHVHNTHADMAHQAYAAVTAPLVWLRRHRERRELEGVLDFPEYLLKDIGVQRSDIAREAVKPFWRP